MKQIILIITLILILPACADTGTSLTLEANYALASTQMEDLRITATVQAARAETTLDFMGTRAALSGTQSRFLEETLVATGFSADVLATQRQSILGSTATPLPTATFPLDAPQNINPNQPPLDRTFTPTPPAVTLNAPNPTSTSRLLPTPDLGGMSLGTLVTATDAGFDGCGEGISSVFSMDTFEIYVILPAFNITANDYTFEARWQHNGQPVGPVYDFTPDYDTDKLCIWFFVDRTDFPFEPGNYTVSIDVNGQPAAGPVPFVIQ